MGVGVICGYPFLRRAIIIIDGDFRTTDCEFVIAAILCGSGIPMIGLHHRAIEFLQILIHHRLIIHYLVQWHTHDFPTVVVKENYLGLKRSCDKLKLTISSVCSPHINGLEPVVFL